jgi:hypothetical protein
MMRPISAGIGPGVRGPSARDRHERAFHRVPLRRSRISRSDRIFEEAVPGAGPKSTRSKDLTPFRASPETRRRSRPRRKRTVENMRIVVRADQARRHLGEVDPRDAEDVQSLGFGRRRLTLASGAVSRTKTIRTRRATVPRASRTSA